MTGSRQVIIDCDPGIDDALALMLALRSPELDVRAVTIVAGNVGLDQCVVNARRVCQLAAGSAGPAIHAGAGAPLMRKPVEAAHVHGPDGMGGLSSELETGRDAEAQAAEEAILSIAAGAPGEVTLITLGPLTNAALAARRDPIRFAKLAGIVSMGGAFAIHGNITAMAEFNIFADPHAAQTVIDTGVPLRMVGLDVTTQVRLRQADRERAAPHPVATFAARVAEFYAGFYRPYLGDGCYLHDPLAIGAVIDPTLVSAEKAAVAVETEGAATLGMTAVDRRPWSEAAKRVEICTAVDAPRFLALFHERVLQ